MKPQDTKARIDELETELRHKDERIKELKADLGEAMKLNEAMTEQVQDGAALIDSWIEVFGLRQDDAGVWQFDPKQSELWERHVALHEEHQALIRRWNKFVGDYNSTVAPRDRGRPLEATEPQAAQVRKLRKAGMSLRAIAAETSLGLRTVRTIVEKAKGADRTTKRTNELRKMELNRLRAAEWRSRNRDRKALEKRINGTRKEAGELIKAAKGLDRRHG